MPGNGNGNSDDVSSFLDSFSIIGNVQDVSKLSVEELNRELELLRAHRRTSSAEKRNRTKKKNNEAVLAAKESEYAAVLAMVNQRLAGQPQSVVDHVMGELRKKGMVK